MKNHKGFLYELRKNKTLFLMVSPTVLFFFVFGYLPMVGIYYAFTSFNFNGGLFGSPFIGFKNFEFLFNNSALIITRNTILYNLAFIIIGNVFQLVAAVIISELAGRYVKKFMQSVMFLPYFVSYVLLGAFVYNLFNFEFGTINTLLRTMQIEPVDIYSSPSYWKFIIIGFYIWKNIGYGSIVYLAAIMSFEREYYESAVIDGASIFQQVRYITVPLLKPTFILLVLFSLGSIMRGQFDLFYQLVGNNGLLFNATEIIDTYVYRTLTVNFDIGLGTAAGVFQSVVGFIIVITVNYIVKKSNKDYALF